MKFLETLHTNARALHAEVYALYLAYKHPEVSWVAKVVIAVTIGYALSPIDLIPDFIPVFGFLDDLIIVPIGIVLSIRLIPPAIMQACRLRSETLFREDKPKVRYAWLIVLFTWLLLLAASFLFIRKFWQTGTEAWLP